jgi:hypothetical protein
MAFSTGIKRIGWALALASSAVFAQEVEDTEELLTQEASLGEDARLSPEGQALRASGNTMFWTGNALALGGLAVVFAAVVTDREAFALAGGLAYAAGAPVLGFGADRVYRAYRLYDPQAGRDGRFPWFYGGLGLGMQSVGALMLVQGAENSRGGLTGQNGGGKRQIVAGTVMLLGGAGLYSVSWLQFAARRDAANRHLANVPLATLRLEPFVPLSERGLPEAWGGRLSLRF